MEELYKLTPPKFPKLVISDAFSLRSMLGPLFKQGTRGIVDLLRVAPMTMTDLMDEWFESEF